jgi:hypothetical protein
MPVAPGTSILLATEVSAEIDISIPKIKDLLISVVAMELPEALRQCYPAS